jgi:hypothetical protein
MVYSQDNQSMQFVKGLEGESKVREIASVITKISHCGNKQSQMSRHGLHHGEKVAQDGILNALL